MKQTKFYTFCQNNSGGHFDESETQGLAGYVIIEAKNAKQANNLAKKKGIYFYGVSLGVDCECCGDRWHPVEENEGTIDPMIYNDPVNDFNAFGDRDHCYVHYLNGNVNKIEFAI
jgi:hypothetical protein